jgi:hypothetical protein
LAEEIINENHPLSTSSIKVVFPLFKAATSCCSKKDGALDEPLIKAPITLTGDLEGFKKAASNHLKKKSTINVSDVPEGSDPFNLLGFGMVAYKDLMWTSILLFTVLSILMSPAMFYYKSFNGISEPKSLAKFSLGNMGFSKAECVMVPFDLTEIPIYCPYGAISEIKYIGINPDLPTASKDACMDTKENAVCNSLIKPDYKTNIKTFCDGKNDLKCNFVFNEKDMEISPLPAECIS